MPEKTRHSERIRVMVIGGLIPTAVSVGYGSSEGRRLRRAWHLRELSGLRHNVESLNERVMRRWQSAGPLAVLISLTLLACSTRALPLAISPLPFNNDGMTEARIASDILVSGGFDFPEGSYYSETHSIITPAYDAMLAYVSASLGSSPYDAAQYVVACIGVLTITGIYLVALNISKSRKGALTSAMVLSLSGTFVFLTDSAWKASLGASLLVFLAYAHMNRSDRKMLLLEIVLLSTLVLVHHLVALLAYLAIAFSLGVSIFNSIFRKRFGAATKIDIVVITVVSICAFLYYYFTSLDRFSSVIYGTGLLTMIGIFAAMLSVSVLVLRPRNYSRWTFAPVPSVVVLALFVWEYYSPVFPYTGGFPAYVLILGAITAIMLGVAWFGIEYAIMSSSRYRAISIIWLLPVMTVLLYAVAGGTTLSSHQIIYRSFDFGYIPLAMGISFTIAAVASKPRREFFVAVSILGLLLVSFPFGYMTNTLEGIRHDSQEYEIDALTWVYLCEGRDAVIQSDERISYNGRALFDFTKRPHVPDYLTEMRFPSNTTLNLYLEEWAVTGVNHYPAGHIIIDPEIAFVFLEASDVLYVGGPSENNIVIFRSSELGQFILIGA